MGKNIRHQIAMVVNHLGNPFEASLVSHVESLIMERGYQLILHTYQYEKSEIWLHSVADQIDGVLLLGQTLPDSAIARFREFGVPIVSLLQPAWYKQGVSYVDMNWIKAMRKIIEYLQSRGHTRIGFMTHGHPAHPHTQRFSAFIQAMQLCKGKFEHGNVLHGGGTYLKAFDAMEERIKQGNVSFSAIVCANDLMAIGVIAACRHHRIHIPGQLAVIGCEDILMSSETNPPLTTVQYSREQLTQAAVNLLFSKIYREEVSLKEIEGYLLLRDSG